MINNDELRQADVLVIDYHVGNHLSVLNALDRLGYIYDVSDTKEAIKNASAFILPGVGAFAEAMNNLKSLDLIDTLRHEVIENKKPILGICLGMQILADSSEEKGDHKGLGLIPGKVCAFPKNVDVRIPHVGWNTIDIQNKSPLFDRTPKDPHFYFDHSYYYQCEDTYVAATCNHGISFNAAIQKDNIFGVQFHPEKSQNTGLKLLRGFFAQCSNHD